MAKTTKKTADRQPTKLEKVTAEAAELDIRRQKQIANQTETINRLLVDGSYDTEMAVLHQTLAETQAVLEQTRARLEEVERAIGD